MKKNLFLAGALAALIVAVFAGCASMTLVSVDTAEGPREVGQGQIIAPSQITVWGTYKDGSRKEVSIKPEDIIFDGSSPGSQTVRIRISRHEASFQTEVLPIVGVELERPPTSTSIEMGDSVDLAGIGLYGIYEGSSLRRGIIAEDQITASGYDNSTLGQTEVTVTVAGQSATYTITVTPAISGYWIVPGGPPADRISFRNGQYSRTSGLDGRSTGSYNYTIEGDNIILQSTSALGSSIHPNLSPGLAFTRETVGPALALYRVPEDEIDAAMARFEAVLRPRAVPFSIDGDTLTMGNDTFTRVRTD